MTTPPLSEDEKNELVLKYQNIVYYYANRYRFFDPEIEEVQAWGFMGLAKAINRFSKDRDTDIELYIFTMIRREILRTHTRNRVPKYEKSMNEPVASESDTSLESSLGDNTSLFFEVSDIREIIIESLFEEEDSFIQMNLDYLLTKKTADEIADKYNITRTYLNRTRRRGQALIKTFLINNNPLLDFVSDPSEEFKKKKKIINHRKLTTDDFGKIKYVRKKFSFLDINDIALLMGTSSYMIAELFSYPTSTYLRCASDDSIKGKALAYCQRKYPERLPSEVKVYEMA